MVGYLLLIGTAVIFAITREGSAADRPERDGEYRYIYVRTPPPMPFMLGSRGRMVRSGSTP
jgi:hypothetical protein